MFRVFARSADLPYDCGLKKRKTKNTCKQCKGEFPASRYSCPRCGTPVDERRIAAWNQKRARKLP